MSHCLFRALPAALLLLTACGDGESQTQGTGTISVRAYGESFIEDGIPAEDMNDGWAIAFERFDVSLRDLVVAGVALEDPDPVDVAAASDGEGHALGSVTVATGSYSEPAFTIARVEIAGSAEKDGVTKTFAWTFAAPTRYQHCDAATNVRTDAESSFQITVHADHLFYDSLVSEEPELLFDAIAAADADGDGDVTQAELAVRDIGSYDPGNDHIDDLWSWLIAQHRTLGHVDGEGHCDATPSD